MRLIKIFVSGSQEDLQHEWQILAHVTVSLRVKDARIDVQYSAKGLPRDQLQGLVHACDLFVGLYNRTTYGSTDPVTGLSFAESEFDQAHQLQKPMLIFLKPSLEMDRISPRQHAFIERAIGIARDKSRIFEFKDTIQLEELAADVLMSLL